MDLNQIFELVQKCSPAVALIGAAIGGYFWIQNKLAETRKFHAEARVAELVAIRENNELQLESLRKGETGDQPSETLNKHEFPKLLKANWTQTVSIGFALSALIVFCVDFFSSPLTAYVLANMMFLLFAALLNLLVVGFQVLQRQEENNFRIQKWISIEGQYINLELTKIQHAANAELTKIQYAANAELTKATLGLIAQSKDEIIDQIKKLRDDLKPE